MAIFAETFTVSKFFYRFFIFLYPVLIRLAAPFNQKAKLWTKGRENVLERMRKQIASGTKLIWMHCSSLGEFEQGRPVLEKLRTLYPTHKILLTFFSPSGYEVREDYSGADYIFYLPMDSSKNAAEFFNIANPALAIFVKYEFWYYYLAEAKKRNVPLLLVSAIFRKSQPFFSKSGELHRQMLSFFTHIFVQNQESIELLQSIAFAQNVSLSGDTRFDRVIEIAESFQPIASIETFCAGFDVVVAGSTWTDDDKELSHYANSSKNVRFIIAPHNIVQDRLNECKRLYKNSILFSSLSSTIPSNVNTIIIDNIGMLSRLYKYSTVSFIGGGFGAEGVHNVLEAAVYGKPTVFGLEYQKYFEAVELVENGGGFPVKNALNLEAELDRLLRKDDYYLIACESSKKYVYGKKGSTEKILQFIQEKRLLTS